MNKDYSKYTTEDLLEDDFFIQSNLSPTFETSAFWQKQITAGLDEQEYKLAVYFLDSVKVKKEEMTSVRQDLLWEKIKDSNKILQLNRNRRTRFFMMVAASIAVLVISSVSYLYNKVDNTPDVETIARTMATVSESDEIQLVLSDKKIPISGKDSKIQHDTKGTVVVNSEKVVEVTNGSSDTSEESAAFNQLVVPNGKRSTLILEDGTKVWVNAGSRVVYPVAFAVGKREIYVDGEVFLEVTPDKKRPFIVKTNDMNVKVLGTSFNVLSYAKDRSSSIVLVTGSVEVDTKNKEDYRLTPNNMLSYQEGKCAIKEVDVADYISWKEGLYTYRSEDLSVILERLSRYYGKKINYRPEVGSLKCSGKLDMQEDLEVVLDGLANTAPVIYKKVGEDYVLVKVGE